MKIREARPEDLVALEDIERAAGRPFVEIGMLEVADDDPFSLGQLERYREEGHLWVAIDVQDQPIGYLVVERVDGNAHIEQVSVHPNWSGQRIGCALIERVVRWARVRDLDAVTLTTFAEVPWNAPYYQRLGFRILDDENVTPGLRDKRRAEAAEGLERWPRVCMRRDL